MCETSEEKIKTLLKNITDRFTETYKIDSIRSKALPIGDTFLLHWEIRTPFSCSPIHIQSYIPSRGVKDEIFEDWLDYVFHQYEEVLVKDFKRSLRKDK